ncbi:MAG: thermonuclease family protein [Candidatus Omnitrophica bacterium]|nr:thermonuclease family protein [Candidatus Omnitrophota bacterium]
MRDAILILVCGLLGFLGAGPAVAADRGRVPRLVERVIDGDTVVLDGGEPLRLIGINAPEYQPHKHRIDPYGKESAACARRRLDGKKIFLEYDIERRDKYKRTLAYAYSGEGELVNRALVAEGCAKAGYYPPNGRHYRAIKEAEKEAKARRKGLWAVVD